MKTWLTGHKKLAVGIDVGAVVIALVLILVFTVFIGEQPLTAAELLDLGEKYMLDLNYEQALVQFLGVIEIEPKNPRGYIGAAEAYLGQGDTDSAISILEKGLAALPGDADIQAKLDEILSSMSEPEPTPTPTPTPEPEHTGIYNDVDDAKKLAFALASEADIVTINIVDSFTYTVPIELSGFKDVTINLSGHMLTVDVVESEGWVTAGVFLDNGAILTINGSGIFDVTSRRYGIYASGEGSTFAFTGEAIVNALSTGGAAVSASNSGVVNVSGNATANGKGVSTVSASKGGAVNVGGDALATGESIRAIYTSGGTVTVGGNVTATVDAMVPDNIKDYAFSSGVMAFEGGQVTVGGDVSVTGEYDDAIHAGHNSTVDVTGDAYGYVTAYFGSTVTVGGNVTDISGWGRTIGEHNGGTVIVKGSIIK